MPIDLYNIAIILLQRHYSIKSVLSLLYQCDLKLSYNYVNCTETFLKFLKTLSARQLENTLRLVTA